VTAGKPVVATAFPHAVELLSEGAGIVVPHRDAASIAEALRTIITRPDLAYKHVRHRVEAPRRSCCGRLWRSATANLPCNS